MHDVLIAGAGPTGLMLAAELALAKVDVVIVERRSTQEIDGTRARGIQSRTIEVFDQRGIAERFLTVGKTAQVQAFGGVVLDISDFPTRHNYGLAIKQSEVESILAGWVSELGVRIIRECDVTGFTQGDTGVDVELSSGEPLRAKYLVGCDGGRSRVRKAAGIEFAGWDATKSWLIAEVEMAEQPEFGVRESGGIGPSDTPGRIQAVLCEAHVKQGSDPTLQDVRDALIANDGKDYGVHNLTFITRFTDTTRQATAYRDGRVLLAGDAAHVHPPQGGQGISIGLQDAVNLGWKLAQVVRGTSPESLLDTYHDERHPIGARVQRNSLAQIAIIGKDERHDALRGALAELLSVDDARKHFAGVMSGLDIHYDIGEGHPLLGRRLPDLDVKTPTGEQRVYEFLHEAKSVLLNLGKHGAFDIAPWATRISSIDATYDGPWELPVIGDVPAPTAVLIRPDGYVVWVGDGTDAGLHEALTTWFGPAA